MSGQIVLAAESFYPICQRVAGAIVIAQRIADTDDENHRLCLS